MQMVHQNRPSLRLSHLTQTSDGRPNSRSRGSAESVGTASVDLLARLALPDADRGPLDGFLVWSILIISVFLSKATYLATRWAWVSRVLSDFHLLHAEVVSPAPVPRCFQLTSYGAKHRNGYRTFRSRPPSLFAWSGGHVSNILKVRVQHSSPVLQIFIGQIHLPSLIFHLRPHLIVRPVFTGTMSIIQKVEQHELGY